MDSLSGGSLTDKKLAKKARMRKINLERRMTKSFACDQCEYVTSRKTHIRGHIRYAHEGNTNLLACKECDLKTTFHRMKQHILAVHAKAKDFQCQEVGCGFKSATKYGISVHVKAKHDIKNSTRYIGTTQVPPSGNIKDDTNNEAVNKYLFDDKLLPLPLLATSVPSFACHQCEYKTPRKSHLRSHVKHSHKKNKNMHNCKLCDYKTERSDHLQAHENSVHGEVKVDFIEYDDTPYDLENDFPLIEEAKNIGYLPISRVVDKVRPVMLGCMWCDYMSESRDDLQKHEKTMHSEVKVDFIEYDDRLYDLENADENVDVSMKEQSQDVPKASISNEEKEDTIDDTKNEQESKIGIIHSNNDVSREKEVKGSRHVNIYNCDQCDYMTSRKVYLVGHTKYAHKGNANMIVCDHCDYITEQKQNFMKHLTKRHSGVKVKLDDIKKFSCLQCNYKSSRKANLDGHIKYVHQRIINMTACELCDYMTERSDQLKNHLRKMHSGQISIKDMSKQPIKEENMLDGDNGEKPLDNLLERNENVTESADVNKYCKPLKPIPCGQCDYVASRKAHLRGHIKHAHKGMTNLHACEQCDYKTERKDHLKLHMNSMHRMTNLEKADVTVLKSNRENCKPVKGFSCGKCNYVASRKTHLRGHIKYVHEGITNLQACVHCDFKTETKYVLQKHLQSMHKMVTLKTESRPEWKDNFSLESVYKACYICDDTLVGLHALTKHLRMHGEGKFPCQTCSAECTSGLALHEHMRAHFKNLILEENGENHRINVKRIKKEVKIFSCEECDYETSRKAHLRGHTEYAHKGNVNMLTCDHCYYMTEKSYNLRTHLAKRHGEENIKEVRKFSCNQCDYMTPRKANLRGHIKNKHKGNTNMIACGHCDFMTERKYHLKNHVTKVHREVDPKIDKLKNLSCEQCDYRTSRKVNMKGHIKFVHEGNQNMTTCDHCDYMTERKGHYNNHLKKVHGVSHLSKDKIVDPLEVGSVLDLDQSNGKQPLENLRVKEESATLDMEVDVSAHNFHKKQTQKTPVMKEGLNAECFKCQAWFPNDDTFLIHVGECNGKVTKKPRLNMEKPEPLSCKAKTISNLDQESHMDSKTSNEDIGYGTLGTEVEMDQDREEIYKPGPLTRKAKRLHSTDPIEDFRTISPEGSASASTESDSVEQIFLNKFMDHMKGPRVRLNRLAKCQMCDFVAENVKGMTSHMLSKHVDFV